MIKQIIMTIGLAYSLFCSQCIADSGQLFNVTVAGLGPIGYRISSPRAQSGTLLCVNSTTPSWSYQFAGIKVNTPGYRIPTSNKTLIGGVPLQEYCTLSDNGYCLFPASDTTIVPILVYGPATAGTAEFSLCLNGVGSTYSCEKHIIPTGSAPEIPNIIGNSISCNVTPPI